MLTVHKYPLPGVGLVGIEMPRAARVLSVQAQEGRPFLWAQVDTEQPTVRRQFRVAGTGHPLEGEVVDSWAFVGTFQVGPIVIHVWDAGEA